MNSNEKQKSVRNEECNFQIKEQFEILSLNDEVKSPTDAITITDSRNQQQKVNNVLKGKTPLLKSGKTHYFCDFRDIKQMQKKESLQLPGNAIQSNFTNLVNQDNSKDFAEELIVVFDDVKINKSNQKRLSGNLSKNLANLANFYNNWEYQLNSSRNDSSKTPKKPSSTLKQKTEKTNKRPDTPRPETSHEDTIEMSGFVSERIWNFEKSNSAFAKTPKTACKDRSEIFDDNKNNKTLTPPKDNTVTNFVCVRNTSPKVREIINSLDDNVKQRKLKEGRTVMVSKCITSLRENRS